MSYLSSSEFVSPGHPDRLADVIAAKLIDKIQKKDGPNCHAAVEVFITKELIVFGGEVTTTLFITDDVLRECVNEAYNDCGYIPEMRKHWSSDQVALASDMKILNVLSPQSPDIALGTTDKGEDSGYNDQGVFFSSSEDTRTGMGIAMEIASLIGMKLFEQSRKMILDSDNSFVLGPDNKVVVTVEVGDNGYEPDSDTSYVKAITIAVAHSDASIDRVRDYVKTYVKSILGHMYSRNIISADCEWVINGTGKFVVHGAASDTSMTGRKISVNHPSAGPVWANKMIGGGSLVKPWHASDFILNVFCRFISNVVVEATGCGYAIVGCASAIGQKRPQSIFIKTENLDDVALTKYFTENYDLSPRGIADLFGFWNPDYRFDKVVLNNFFGDPDSQPWERRELIKEHARLLALWYNSGVLGS